MLPNLMRAVIAQVARGGRSVASRRNLSSSSGQLLAGGPSVRNFSGCNFKAPVESGPAIGDSVLLYGGVCLGAFLHATWETVRLCAAHIDQAKAKMRFAEQEDDI